MSLLLAGVDVCPAEAIRTLVGFWREQNKFGAAHRHSVTQHALFQQHIFIKTKQNCVHGPH